MINRYKFTENEEIARQNSKLSKCGQQTKTLLNYNDKKEEINSIISKSSRKQPFRAKRNKNRERYSHCKNKSCGVVLEHPHSRVWGYCPLCDML